MVLSCHKEMVMPQRVPIRDLKHTANISALCHESKERLFSAAKIARLKNTASLPFGKHRVLTYALFAH